MTNQRSLEEVISTNFSVECSHDTFSNSSIPTTAESNRIKIEDPFLYYSNETIRMKTLKMVEVSESDASQERGERKTRLSFELHPSLILEDVMTEIFGDDISWGSGHDVEDNAKGNGKTDLLTVLLRW